MSVRQDRGPRRWRDRSCGQLTRDEMSRVGRPAHTRAGPATGAGRTASRVGPDFGRIVDAETRITELVMSGPAGRDGENGGQLTSGISCHSGSVPWQSWYSVRLKSESSSLSEPGWSSRAMRTGLGMESCSLAGRRGTPGNMMN